MYSSLVQESTVQPDHAAKTMSPRDAAGLFGLWGILAAVSLMLLLALVVVSASRRKSRLTRLRSGPVSPTTYVDAWKESGKRLPPPDDLEKYIDIPPPDTGGNFDVTRRHGPRGGKPGGKGSDA